MVVSLLNAEESKVQSTVLPPCLHEEAGVGETEAHVPGPLGQHTQPSGQQGVDSQHLTA